MIHQLQDVIFIDRSVVFQNETIVDRLRRGTSRPHLTKWIQRMDRFGAPQPMSLIIRQPLKGIASRSFIRQVFKWIYGFTITPNFKM